MAVVKKEFGKNSKGELAHFYEITNGKGMKAVVTDFGATLHSLYVPDKDGNLRDVVWGYDTVTEYEIDNGPYFGATVGRIANRVGGALVTIHGVDYPMEVNERTNCLHSGPNCYHVRMWNAEILENGSIKFNSAEDQMAFSKEHADLMQYEIEELETLELNFDDLGEVEFTPRDLMTLEGVINFVE